MISLFNSLLNKESRVPRVPSGLLPECPSAQVPFECLSVHTPFECPSALIVLGAQVPFWSRWSVLRVLRCPFNTSQAPFECCLF